MTTQIKETTQVEEIKKSGASHDQFFKDSFSNPKRANDLPCTFSANVKVTF